MGPTTSCENSTGHAVKSDDYEMELEDINTKPKIKERRVQSSKQTGQEQSLVDIKKFKPTRTVAKPLLKLLSSNLRKFISDKYLLVTRQVFSQVREAPIIVKTYVFLVFKNQTDLRWMRKAVHKILPLIEIDDDCESSDCVCKATNRCLKRSLKRKLKRQGFGYLHEKDIASVESQARELDYDFRIKRLPTVRRSCGKKPTDVNDDPSRQKELSEFS